MTSALIESGVAFETQSGTEAAGILARCCYEWTILRDGSMFLWFISVCHNGLVSGQCDLL